MNIEYPKYINGLSELNNEIHNNHQKNILLVFTATWCGPCQKLKKDLITVNQDGSNSGLQHKYQDKLIILYIDVDVSENEELMEIYKVTGMPTQILLKTDFDKESNKISLSKIGEIVGYDMINLMMKLEEYC